ncbi:MAG: DUF1353 domain-containing protein [Ilumatobacteraceae bacterium]
MAAETLTPISDDELGELLAAPGPIGDALAPFSLTVVQALRVAEHERGAFTVGRIDRPSDAGPPFFDPLDMAKPPDIVLRRIIVDRDERFRLVHRIGYPDRDRGVFIVPADVANFETDLTSVPAMFAWLVPQTGLHLPAALVHDAMTPDRGEVARKYIGPEVDRVVADRIFRRGMRDLGTSIVRSWIVWAAVAIASAWADPRPRHRFWWQFVVAFSGLTIVTLGGLATVDLFDCRADLPWMGERPLWQELLFGAGVAILVPAILSVLWGKRWGAGLIGGVALALVLHVTLVIVVLLSAYTLAENIVRPRRAREILLGLAGLVLAGGGPVVFLLWACR